MTCARRLAGARKPASSTSAGSPRPDPRPGRRRARLPGLLPALALLLGALSLLPAAPAQAQTVTNLVVTPGNGKLVASWTGPGQFFVMYTSSSTVELQATRGLSGTTHATHWKALHGSAITATTYTVPNLSNGTTYRVRVRYADGSIWVEASGTPMALAAPGGIDVTRDRTAGGVLRVTWGRVSGATGYEAEWRLASDASAVGSDTAIAATKGTSSDAFYITGLTNDTAYEFRVRAKDADGGGTWSGWHGGTPGTAAAVIWTGTLSTGSDASSLGCHSGAPCATRLSPNTFTVGGTEFTVTEARHWQLGQDFFLTAKVSPDTTTAVHGLEFCSGPVAIPMSTSRAILDADTLVSFGHLDGRAIVDWQPNTQVALRIGSDCAQAAEAEWPLVAPRLDGLTLTAGGTPLTLIQGRIHPDQGGPGTTGFKSDTQRYMAVVPYETSEVTLTPEFTNAFGQASSARDQRYRGGGRPVFTEAERVLTFVNAIASGSSYTLHLGPSEEGGKPLELWKRHTEVLVRVYRRHPYYPHTKLEYTYTVLIVQGGPIPVDLSVEGLTGNVLPNGGTATLKATIPVPLPMDSTIPLTVGYAEAQKGDVLFRPHPDRFPNQYYGLDRPVDIFMRRGETEASIEIVSQPDPDRTSNELLLIELDSSGFPVAGSTRWGSNAVEVAPWTLTEGSSTSPTLSLGAAMPSTEPRVVGITAELFALIQKIEGWRDDPALSWHRPHVMRWNRVLLALGWSTVTPASDASLEPMSAAEAQTYADRGWTRWIEVAEALRELEPVAVTIAGGAPVTEGEAAAFTLTVSRARAADLAVAVSVADVSGRGAFASEPGTRTVTVPAGSTSAAFTVATVDDAEDEADGAVVATLAAGSGYTLGDAARARVAVADNDEGLPEIVTKRSTAREGTDEAVVFTVRLGRAASHAVTVDYATADAAGPAWTGTAPARAGADYTATSGTLTFAPGQRFGSVRVPILDDAIDEGMEYFLLRFSNPQGAVLPERYREAQGLIRNSDPLQAMWLSRFGRMVASDAVASVTARLETPRDAGSHLTLAGQRLDPSGDGAAFAKAVTGLARAFGAEVATSADDDPFAGHGLSNTWNDPAATTAARSMTGRELLLGTSFRAVLGSGAGPRLTSWGQGASVSRFSAAVPGLGLSGESATGSMGLDYERGRLLTGFAMTHSVGEGAARDAGWRYALGSTATMWLPYARYRVSERVSAWGLAGTGKGRLTLDLDGGVPQHYGTDLSMTLAAAGVRGDLVTPAEAGGFALALKADAFWVRAESDRVAASEFGSLAGARGESSRVRAVLDGSRAFAFAGGAVLTPSVELGVRHDGGDAETGTGLEFGAGLGYADPSWGLDMALRVHGLAVHAEEGYGEWGVSGQLRLVPGVSGRGLSASLVPSYGVDPGGSERLWALPGSSGLAANGEEAPSSRLDAEVGYGMAMFGDRFTGTPNVGLGFSDGGVRDYRMGWRLTSAVRGASRFELNLDATRREPANDNEPDHGVMLRAAIHW